MTIYEFYYFNSGCGEWKSQMTRTECSIRWFGTTWILYSIFGFDPALVHISICSFHNSHNAFFMKRKKSHKLLCRRTPMESIAAAITELLIAKLHLWALSSNHKCSCAHENAFVTDFHPWTTEAPTQFNLYEPIFVVAEMIKSIRVRKALRTQSKMETLHFEEAMRRCRWRRNHVRLIT